MALPLPDNYLSRAPQQQARRAVEQAVLAGEKSISFSMPTGTGKTRVWVALLVALFVSGFQRFILVLPNLNLLDQLKRDYMEKLGWNKKKGVFYVCSEPGTDAIDEADFRRSFPAASEADLRKIYARKQFFIVTTYASLPKVLRDLPAPVDALFMDEAHHEEGPVVLEALETHSAKYKHKISASATLLPSHQPCYTYSLSAAIHDNVIKDYQLYICLMLTTGTSQSKIKFIKDISAKTANTHLIVYTTFSEADREGTTSVSKLVAELAGDPELWVEGLTGAHTREQRQAVVDEFATPLKGAEKVKLLVNCRVFGEGADISAANGIVLDKTTTDPTQLQQNIGRALRKPDGETVPAAAVLFMILVSAEELAKYPMGAERNAALVEQVYAGPGRFAMVAIAGLMKQDPAKVREIMADNQRVSFTRAQPDRAVVETVKETVRLTMPTEDEGEDLNGLADAIVMGTQMSVAEVQNILRGLTEDRSEDRSEDSEDHSEDSDDSDDSSSAASSSTGSSEEQEPFVQRLSEQLGRNVVIHVPGEDMILASEPVGAYDETLELLKTPTGFDLVVPAADKDNERYKPKQQLRRPVNFMQEQELKELVSLGLSDDTDLNHGLTARLEVSVNAKTRAELESEQLALFFKAVDGNGSKALAQKARVDEEGQLVASGGWAIGRFFSSRKTVLTNPSKKDAVYSKLTQDGTNEIVKANLDKYLEDQAKPAQWYESYSDEQKRALFFTAVKMNGAKALKISARVNEEGALVAKGEKGWQIGMFFNNQKQSMKNPLKKPAVYDMLTQDGTNEFVKANLEKFLADQAKPAVWHYDLTNEDKFALYYKTVKLNDDKALAKSARVDEEGQLVAKDADGWNDAWPIGVWFTSRKQELKNPAKKAAIYAKLTQGGTNEIVKAHLEKYLADQAKPAVWYHDLTDEDKFALFHKAVELNGDKALAKSARVDEEGRLVGKGADGWAIGEFLTGQKQKMKDPTKKAATYASLTQNDTNEFVKANLEKFLADQAKPAVWHHDLTDGDKFVLFHKTVEINGAKAFAQVARVNKEGELATEGAEEWDNAWSVGKWFHNKKTREIMNPSKKDGIYGMLTQNNTNEVVKAHLDKFLEDQDSKEWFNTFSKEDMLVLFHKVVELNGAEALVQSARVNEEGHLVAEGAEDWDDAWPVGAWFNRKKQNLKTLSKKDAVYASLTQNNTNEIVKEHLDKFLAFQDQPEKFYEKFSDKQKLDLLLTAVKNIGVNALFAKTRVNEEGEMVVKGADGWGAAWGCGSWFDCQKQKIKDPAKKDAVYDKLTQDGTNEIVKAHLDKFLADQDKKKRKASDVVDEEMEVYDDVATPALVPAAAAATVAEPPKKRQKTTAAPPPPPAAPAAPADPAPPASRKRPAAALEEQEQQEEQPKPKRARKQPKKYNEELSEAAKDKIIQDHLARKQKQAAPAGYRTTNPDEKDRINGVLARYVPPAPAGGAAAGEAKVIFLDHTEFKTAYALLETGRVRPEHMLIPQLDQAKYAEMARHELFGPSVVQGDFNRVLEGFLAAGGVVRSVYADFCSTRQGDGLPFVQLLTKYRAQLAPAAVVGVTVTLRNPEGVRYSGYDINNMNMALWRLLERVPENLFHIDGVLPEDDGPYTYGAGQPMATWLIRGFLENGFLGKSQTKKD